MNVCSTAPIGRWWLICLDDASPMGRCPKCRQFSDTDQALLLENHLLRAIRQVDARATFAHLAYAAWLDGDHAQRWGVAPVRAYGAGLSRWRWVDGKPMERK